MVLQGQPCGRVGRCRGFEGSIERSGPLLFFGDESYFSPADERAYERAIRLVEMDISSDLLHYTPTDRVLVSERIAELDGRS
jgi:hypothetical protein